MGQGSDVENDFHYTEYSFNGEGDDGDVTINQESAHVADTNVHEEIRKGVDDDEHKVQTDYPISDELQKPTLS